MLMLVIVGVNPFGCSGVGAVGSKHDVKGDMETGEWTADSVFAFHTCIVPDVVTAIRKYLDASKYAMGKPKFIEGINLIIVEISGRLEERNRNTHRRPVCEYKLIDPSSIATAQNREVPASAVTRDGR